MLRLFPFITLSLIGVFLTTSHSRGDTPVGNSPHQWSGSLIIGKNSSIFSTRSEFTNFLKNGIHDSKIGLHCNFNFTKNFSKKAEGVSTNKKTEYFELLDIFCSLNNIEIMPKAVMCSENSHYDHEYLRFKDKNGYTVQYMIDCMPTVGESWKE